MRLMCLLAAHLLQCRSSLCLHPGSGLLLSCFSVYWRAQFIRRAFERDRDTDTERESNQDVTQGQFVKRSILALNLEFSFSYNGRLTRVNDHSLPNYLFIAGLFCFLCLMAH